MSEPKIPAPTPNKPLPEQEQAPARDDLATVSRGETLLERMFSGAQGIHPVWRLVIYLICAFLTGYLGLWFGASLFSEPVRGAAAIWREMYEEAGLLFGAMFPALLMAQLEGRRIDDYGLPRHQAFGKMFWVGAIWGLAAITFLMLAMRGVHAFYFGQLALHGVRVLKFAVFWAVYFVLVGLFEEFLMRGYTLHTLAEMMGFWPAALLLSCAFGAIHYHNPGESWAGLSSAVAIGIFFCMTLQRTGTLWFAVGFHAFWDWGQTYLYSVPDSGTMEVGHLMHSSFQGPAWLTGGSVGPEGSVLCFAVIAAVSGVFAWRYRGVRYGVGGAAKEDPHPRGA